LQGFFLYLPEIEISGYNFGHAYGI